MNATSFASHLFAALAILLLASSCDPKDKTVDFTIVASAAVEFEANYGIYLPVEFIPDSLTTDAESKYETNTTNASLVTAAQLNSVSLSMASETVPDCDFLGEILIYLKAPEMDEILIAESSDISNANDVTIFLTPTEGDFTQYINKDNLTMRMVWTGDEFTVDEGTGSIKCDFAVTATKETKKKK